MVVENHKLLTVDIADLARKAGKVRERLEKVNKLSKALYNRLEKVVDTVLVGRQPIRQATRSIR